MTQGRAIVRRNIRLLGVFNFLLDFTLYAPVIIIYFERVTGSYALAMSVLAVVMLSAAIFELPTGIFSDLIGRKWTVVAGAVASLGAAVFYAAAAVYSVLLIGAVLEGLARSLYSGNNSALLYDTLAENGEQADYQVHLGRTSSMYQFALAISALAGGVLAAISFSLVMWLSVIPRLLMVMVSLRFIEPQVHKAESTNIYSHLREAFQNILRNPRLRLLNIGQIISYSVGEAAFQFRTVFIEMLWPLWAIGAARMISNIMAAVSFYFAGPLLKRFGEKRLLFGGIALSQVTNGVALLLQNVFSPVLMGATSIFFGVNTVSLNGMMQREFTDAQRSTMGSLTAFGGSLGFAVCSLIVGWLADTIGVRDALIVATLASSTSLIFFRLAFRETANTASNQPTDTAQVESKSGP